MSGTTRTGVENLSGFVPARMADVQRTVDAIRRSDDSPLHEETLETAVLAESVAPEAGRVGPEGTRGAKG